MWLNSVVRLIGLHLNCIAQAKKHDFKYKGTCLVSDALKQEFSLEHSCVAFFSML